MYINTGISRPRLPSPQIKLASNMRDSWSDRLACGEERGSQVLRVGNGGGIVQVPAALRTDETLIGR